ncbi:prepilin peptidase [Clostridium oryzae]|uniref:Type 4 prepilin-like protein leader peptide-processing enzyme n=1 Tax=Clostridium oryzae TaxID=1450648 RepID=A0A1V4IN92_9CLOT|nr:A24 family peptidase [Clostridium oryzae]OPJ61511.1 type 4 prepilin-like protein leader peptide-processing enzyme [Clostridium oryzae]
MNFFILIYIFILGTIMGSFYNVCIYRIPSGQSIINPPSRCTSCGSKLKAIDLVPIFSYIFLKGKCRYCQSKISPRYALIELFTGIIFACVYIRYGIGTEMIKYEALCSFLIVIGFIDFDTTDVYSIITYTGIAVGIVFTVVAFFLGNDIRSYIYGLLLSGGVIAGIVFVTKAMGTGDIAICALSGLYLGFSKSVVMLFFSFLIGGAAGGFLILSGKKRKEDYIAFGPYIALASIISVLLGDSIISAYMNIIVV